MHRYLTSSIISTMSYLLVGASILYFFTLRNFHDEIIEMKNIQKVSFSIVSPETKPKEEKKTTPEPVKKKCVKKPVKKKIPPKPIEEKPLLKPIEEKPLAEQIEEKAVTNTLEEPVSQAIQNNTSVEKKVFSNTDQTTIDDMTQAKKKMFIAELIKRINNNKSYPQSARRRSMQGTLEIEFIILADGNVKDIKVISGKNIFIRSATKAISDSFPMNIDTTLFNFPKKFKINIEYILK